MIAPEQRVRHEVRADRHAPERGNLARLRQVVRQSVPRHVGRERSHPRGQERERRKGQPGGLDPDRSIPARQPATRAREGREHAEAPHTGEHDRGEHRGQRPGRENADFAEQQDDEADRDAACGERRHEAPRSGLDAREKAGHEVARDERRRHQNGGDAESRRIARCDGHRRGEEEPGPGGEPRTQPQADGKQRERADPAGRRQGQSRGRMQRRELVAVAAQQRQRPPEQDEDRADDEDGTGARPRARGPGLL